MAVGVWGVTSGSLNSSSEVNDEDLQAQGWLPTCLTCLLAQVHYQPQNPVNLFCGSVFPVKPIAAPESVDISLQ